MKRPQCFQTCNLLYVAAALIATVASHTALQAQGRGVTPPYNGYAPATGPQNPCPNYPYTSANIMAALHNNHPDLVMLVDHRGGWYGSGINGGNPVPENSLSAIAMACAANWEMVELDIKESADGVPVLLHDSNLGRNTSWAGQQYCLTFTDNTLNCHTPLQSGYGEMDPYSAGDWDSLAGWTPWNQKGCQVPTIPYGCNPPASQLEWVNLHGMYLRNAGGGFTSDYLAAFDDALQYHIQQQLQIVYVLDIKTSQALKDCWTLVKGYNAGGFVIFKVNGTVFPQGFTQLAGAEGLNLQTTSDYANFHLIPTYTTNMIDQLASGTNESVFNQIVDYGSEAFTIEGQTGYNFLSAFELNVKCPPGSGGTAPDLFENAYNGCNLQEELSFAQWEFPELHEGIFNAIPDADAPGYKTSDWSQGTYQINPSNYTAFFSRDGTCCYNLTKLLEPVAANGGALDPVDLRGNLAFLNEEGLNFITTDDPTDAAVYFANLGKRNTTYMMKNYQP